MKKPKKDGAKTTIDAKTFSGLRVLNGLLREQNIAMKNNLDLRKERSATNSLASISGLSSSLSPFGQTPLTSFNPMLQNNVYAPLTIDWTILMYAYKTHGIIQALVDMPVLDALRGGLNIRSKQLSEDEIGLLTDTLEKKGVLDVIGTAQNWTRLFGGGGIIISTDAPIEEPLDFKHLSKDKQVEFYACNRWELMAPWRTAERYNFYGKTIDASHVITMSGKEAPYTLRWQLAGWGMSELERVLEDFNTYIRIKNVIYELLYEAKVDVYKFKDFAAQMLSAEAEQQTNKRMAITNAQKNFNSAILMDKEDEFEQRQISFSGLAEIYRESRIELAASLRIPMRKLFGLSSTGLNADSSGDTDTENYNAMIESEIRRPLRPVIRQVLDVLCISLFGDTYDLDFEFAPLRMMSAKEEEEINTSKFNRMMTLFDRGLIDAPELSELLSKEKLLDSEIELSEPPEPEVEEIDAAALPERQTFKDGK